jgi:hypothetical protein
MPLHHLLTELTQLREGEVARSANPSPTPKPVTSLSHYTSLAGLIGMVDHGQLWASNVAFLNDREELLHGVKCAQKALDRIVKDKKLAQWADAIAHVVREIEGGRMPNTYAACFCERSDVLSQWRGYGGNEQGVCLVFDRTGLEAYCVGKRSFLAPVQYGLVVGKSRLRQGLQERLLAIADEDLIAMDESDKRRSVYDVLSELIPRFKHVGFKAESEWRLVVQHATLRNSVCFRANRNVLVPYVKLGTGGHLPLKYLLIGPGHDMALTQRSVELFLEAKGYSVPVVLSKVPFRT